MPRYRLTLEYDGGPFAGWQRQARDRSVQEAVEAAVERMTGERVTVVAAGRTDAGVHARGQVAHLDLVRAWSPARLRDGLNAHLRPEPVAVLAAAAAAAPFHARFSAVGRCYLYRILARRAPPALARGQVWHVPHALDLAAMQDAASALRGRHDFTTFRAAGCQAKSPLRTLDQLSVEARGEEVHIEAAARSFLHHQVRSMVGTLVQVGLGRWPVAAVAAALAARNRAACGPVAPAAGLVLTAVVYPASAEQPRGGDADREAEQNLEKRDGEDGGERGSET